MSTTLHMKISCCMGLGPEQQHNECLTASTATTYSSALLEKVFLHSSLGPPLRADPPTALKNPSTAGLLLPALSGGESLRKLCVVHSLLSRVAGKLGQIGSEALQAIGTHCSLLHVCDVA